MKRLGKCPSCGNTFDENVCISDPGFAPSAGDVTVCDHCHAILIFKCDGRLRFADNDEIEADMLDTLADIKRAMSECTLSIAPGWSASLN